MPSNSRKGGVFSTARPFKSFIVFRTFSIMIKFIYFDNTFSSFPDPLCLVVIVFLIKCWLRLGSISYNDMMWSVTCARNLLFYLHCHWVHNNPKKQGYQEKHRWMAHFMKESVWCFWTFSWDSSCSSLNMQISHNYISRFWLLMRSVWLWLTLVVLDQCNMQFIV